MTCTHHKPVTDDDSGEIICRICGIVLEEKRERYEESITPNEDSPSYSRSRMSPHVGASTKMDHSKTSAGNKQLFHRLETWDNRTKARSNNNNKIKDREVGIMCSQLNLPNHVENDVRVLLVKVTKLGLTRGRTIHGIVAAIIKYVCKQRGISKSMLEIAEVANTTPKKLFSIYRVICTEFETEMTISHPADYLEQVASKLGMNEIEIRLARQIISVLDKKMMLSGKSPFVIAGGICYLIDKKTRNRHSQRVAAKASGISEVSLRNFTRQIKDEILYGDSLQKYL